MRVQFDKVQPVVNNGYGYSSASPVSTKGDIVEFLVISGGIKAVVVGDDSKFYSVDLADLRAL